MRGITGLGVAALALAACRQTVWIDQTGIDAGKGPDGGPWSCSMPPTEFIPESPEVIIALDRSNTMTARFGDSSALATARDALDLYAARYQKVVEFGYVEFPSSYLCNGCCASQPSAPTRNYAKFDMALHQCDLNMSPSCATAAYQRPTTPALTNCGVVYSSRFDSTSRWVLLITNGTPDCGSGPNAGCMDAQTAVNDLQQNFVNTVVIAPGQLDPMTSDCLGQMAIIGDLNGASTPPYFHPASNPTDLINAIAYQLHRIAADACHLELTTTRITDPNSVVVTWKDMQIPRGHDGWDMGRDSFTINLQGTWCEKLIEDGPADFLVFPDCGPPRH
jgi:hypothetical protein